VYRLILNQLIYTTLKVFNLEEHVVMLEKYKINSDELLFITVILLIQEGEVNPYINLYFSLPSVCRSGIRDMLISLQNKHIITKEYKVPLAGTTYKRPEDIVYGVTFNQNFLKTFYKASFEMGKELFDIYPLSTVVHGVEHKLRRISKKFDSLEDAFRAYGKAISWKPDKHKEILELVEWGKNNNYQFTIMCDFIVDRDWLNIKAIKDQGTLNSDVVKML
jgi:hypothetical protein